MKTVCWFKNGPYEGDEPLSVVFTDPNDSDCYSALVAREVAEDRITELEIKLRDARTTIETLQDQLNDMRARQ